VFQEISGIHPDRLGAGSLEEVQTLRTGAAFKETGSGLRPLRFGALQSMQDLQLIVQNLGIPASPLNEVHHLREELIGVTPTVADTAHPQGGYLPNLIIIYLRHGNVKPAPQPGGNRLHPPSLFLERKVLGEIQSYPKGSNGHIRKKWLVLDLT